MEQPASHQPTAPKSATILVVDDEPSILKLCRAILQPEGFTILEAEGSSDALKICAKHDGPIDLLLTDLVLPPRVSSSPQAAMSSLMSTGMNWPCGLRRSAKGSELF